MITLQKLKSLIGRDPENFKAPENNSVALKRLPGIKEEKAPLKHTHVVTVHMHDPLTSGVQARIERKVKVQADSNEAAMERAIKYYKSKGVGKAVASKVEAIQETGGAGDWGTDKLTKKYKKDTPGQTVKESLNENFVIDRPVGLGVMYTAADLGIHAKSAFAHHPSVIAEMERRQQEENFMDGKNPEDKGDMSRHGLKGKTIAQLKKIRSSDSASPRQKQLAHWYINMHKGK